MTPMETDENRYDHLTEAIIGAAFDVHNEMGWGYLEKVYENALVHALRKRGLNVDQQVRLTVRYDGVIVGEYIADVFVENVVLVEIKAGRGIDDIHLAQLGNYLKATGLPVGLLLNFGQKVAVRRVVGPAFRIPSVPSVIIGDY